MSIPLRWLALAGLVGLAACAPASDRAADQKTITEGEAAWAASVASGDVATVERLLADDYEGIAPDGSRTSKQSEIEDTRTGAVHYLRNVVTEVRVRFYGDTAIAQGAERWERRDGEPRTGRYVWTDTWLRRGGRWQIVAAEDLVPPESSAAPAPATH